MKKPVHTAEKISKSKKEEQIIAARISIVGSLILFLTAVIPGIAIDSITLILDASSSLVILFVAFLLHFSVKKVHMPPDDYYNFGYSKYEPFTATVQGGLIIATCIICIKFAIQDIIHPDNVHSYIMPVIVTFISGIAGIFITVSLRRIGERTNSSMIKTAALHWNTDTMLSFGICFGFLIGLLLQIAGYKTMLPYVDPVLAIILALIFIHSPVKTILHNVRELLDAVPPESAIACVKKVVEQYKPRSFGVHRLRTRKAGDKVFVEVCFIVKENFTVVELEDFAESFENDLGKVLHNCDIGVHFRSLRNKGKHPA